MTPIVVFNICTKYDSNRMWEYHHIFCLANSAQFWTLQVLETSGISKIPNQQKDIANVWNESLNQFNHLTEVHTSYKLPKTYSIAWLINWIWICSQFFAFIIICSLHKENKVFSTFNYRTSQSLFPIQHCIHLMFEYFAIRSNRLPISLQSPNPAQKMLHVEKQYDRILNLGKSFTGSQVGDKFQHRCFLASAFETDSKPLSFTIFSKKGHTFVRVISCSFPPSTPPIALQENRVHKIIHNFWHPPLFSLKVFFASRSLTLIFDHRENPSSPWEKGLESDTMKFFDLRCVRHAKSFLANTQEMCSWKRTYYKQQEWIRFSRMQVGKKCD
jgi:hypothetical protein